MGTGIVALALHLDGAGELSDAGFALTGVGWTVLVISTGARLARDPKGVHRELSSPAGLAHVAATAVLGSLLAVNGSRAAAVVLLAVALALELSLSPVLLRAASLPGDGTAFMSTVSVQSLTGLAALIAGSWRASWLVYGALAAWAIGAGLYPFALARFDFRQLRTGSGAHWVAGGAIAISALALADATLATDRIPKLLSAASTLKPICLSVWVAAMVWLPVLVAYELAAPRFRYRSRRWSTVFPVGMYATASFQVARVDGSEVMHSFAAVWTWVAVGVWAIVSVGLIKRASRARKLG